jgi:hypothetical protein
MKRNAILVVWVGLLVLVAAGCGPNGVVVEGPMSTAGPLRGQGRFQLGALQGQRADLVRPAVVEAVKEQSGLTLDPEAWMIVSGRVEATLTDTPGEELVHVETPAGEPRRVEVDDPFVDQTFKVKKTPTETESVPMPYVIREASLTLTYQVDEMNGTFEWGPHRLIVRSLKKYGGINQNHIPGLGVEDLPDRRDTYRALAKDLGQRLARQLAPTTERYRLVLDPGRGFLALAELETGVRLAQEGRWEAAAEHWLDVLSQNPDQPTANYNMGVYYERQGGRDNLVWARKYYAAAVKNGDSPLYREALARTSIALRRINENGS